MIDTTLEQLHSLADATGFVPPARQGKKTHLSTLLRWILSGAKAPDGTLVRLDAVRLGGRWFTSREALQRFGEALTPRLDGEQVTTPRSPAVRQRSNERAAKQLERAGI